MAVDTTNPVRAGALSSSPLVSSSSATTDKLCRQLFVSSWMCLAAFAIASVWSFVQVDIVGGLLFLVGGTLMMVIGFIGIRNNDKLLALLFSVSCTAAALSFTSAAGVNFTLMQRILTSPAPPCDNRQTGFAVPPASSPLPSPSPTPPAPETEADEQPSPIKPTYDVCAERADMFTSTLTQSAVSGSVFLAIVPVFVFGAYLALRFYSHLKTMTATIRMANTTQGSTLAAEEIRTLTHPTTLPPSSTAASSQSPSQLAMHADDLAESPPFTQV